jgi:xylulokinase
MKYFLGYDIGSSSVKVALLEAETGKTLASATSPSSEMTMIALQAGWAEQSPEMWWQEVVNATAMLRAKFSFDKKNVGAIGISYQMHGLVLVDKHQNPLRNAIIWCDSRAVSIGEQAFQALGEDFCFENYLNSPANFTASKLRWVIENEPEIWEKNDVARRFRSHANDRRSTYYYQRFVGRNFLEFQKTWRGANLAQTLRHFRRCHS